MRILYIHQYFSTPKDSGGLRSYYISKALINKGFKIKMVFAPNDRSVKYNSSKKIYKNDFEGIQLYKINALYSNKLSLTQRTKVFFKFIYYSTKLVLKEDYDVIYATSTPITVFIPAIIGKIIRRKNIVLEVRDLWPELPVAMRVIKNPIIIFLLKLLEIISYKLSDYMIGLSPGIVEGIKKYKKNNVYMIPNFSNPKFFIKKKKFKFQKNKKIKFVYTGAFGLANGLHRILNLVSSIKDRINIYNSIEFHFYGTGKKENELINIKNNKLLDNCFFHKQVSKKNIPKILVKYDIGIMCLDDVPEFYYGTSPNKFFDYLSAGLPIICNYPGWVSEIIEKNNCGFYIKDENQFIKIIDNIKTNKIDLREFSNNSHQLALNKFNISVLKDNLYNLFSRFKI